MDHQGGPPNVRDQPEGGQPVETAEEHQAKLIQAFQDLALLNKPPQQHPGGQMGPNGMPNGAQCVEYQATYSEKLRSMRGHCEMLRTLASQCRQEGNHEATHKFETMLDVLEGKRIVSMELLNHLEMWLSLKKDFLDQTRYEDNHANRGGPSVPAGQMGPNGMPNGEQGPTTVEDQATYSEKLRSMRGNCEMLRTLASQCRQEGNHEATHKFETMLDVLEGKRVISMELLNQLEMWISLKKDFLDQTRYKDNHANRGGPGVPGGQMGPNQMPNEEQGPTTVEEQAAYSEKLWSMRGNCELLRTRAHECRQEGKHYAAQNFEAMLSILQGKRVVSMEYLNHLETWFSRKQDYLNPTRLEDNHANRGVPGVPGGQMGPNGMPNGAQGEMSVEEQAIYAEKLWSLRGNCELLRTRAHECRQEGNHYAAQKLEVMLDVLEGRRVVSMEYLNDLETWFSRKKEFLNEGRLEDNHANRGVPGVPGGQMGPNGGPNEEQGPTTVEDQAAYSEKLTSLRGNCESLRARAHDCRQAGYDESAQKLEVMLDVLEGRKIVSLQWLKHLETWISWKKEFLNGNPQSMSRPPPHQSQQRMMEQEDVVLPDLVQLERAAPEAVVELGVQEPDVRVMMENLQLEHDDGAEEQDDWVMVD